MAEIKEINLLCAARRVAGARQGLAACQGIQQGRLPDVGAPRESDLGQRIIGQLLKSKNFKIVEKNYATIAQSLKESEKQLSQMKKMALECIAEGAPCDTTEKDAKEVVKASFVQRQLVYKLFKEP